MRVHRIGIVGCAEADARTLQRNLVRHGYLADVMEASADIVVYTQAVRPLALVIDIGSDQRSSAYDIISTLRQLEPAPLIIVVGPDSDPACQIESLVLGAHDFLPQPLQTPELLARLNILLGNDAPDFGLHAPVDKIRQVLTDTENEIFAVLHDAMPRTLSREEIMWEARKQRISPTTGRSTSTFRTSGKS